MAHCVTVRGGGVVSLDEHGVALPCWVIQDQCVMVTCRVVSLDEHGVCVALLLTVLWDGEMSLD